MGSGSSGLTEAEKLHRETQLLEFASQYKNVDMPHLNLQFYIGNRTGLIITNTSDMPAALKALGDMAASLQVPLQSTLKDKMYGFRTQAIGPFSLQCFKLSNVDSLAFAIYEVALADALEPLGWKQMSRSADNSSSITISFSRTINECISV
jgi:hypothetical protein